ncbi:MAG TPA: DUF502 domain-containing protein [Bauldia sp.]|nr:DUF502 domain-containing protein [Bauldia sp.]
MTDAQDPIAPPPPEEEPGRRNFMYRLRNYFLTGLVIAVPLFLTVYLTWAFIVWIDSYVTPLIPPQYTPDAFLPFHVPGFGVMVALVFITLLGFLTANLVGRRLVAWGESILARVPLMRNLYKGLKQVVERAVSTGNKPFQTVGLIEYPRQGLWSVVFVMNRPRGELKRNIAPDGEEILSVFVPTTPTALTGYVVLVPRSKCVILDMPAEDALKLIISAGLVAPESESDPDPLGRPVRIEELQRRLRLPGETTTTRRGSA